MFSVTLVSGMGIHYVWANSPTAASGWAWGGTHSADGAYQGLGWVSFSSNNVGSGGGNYAVTIPVTNGPLSGYAWSSHYGWISFNGADLAGCSPTLDAPTRVGDALIGGARIIAIRDAMLANNAGGYNGCISLAGDSGVRYGVTVSGGNLSGYAWSSDLGWLNMAGVLMPPLVNLGATGCTILPGQSTCNGQISWTFYNVPPPENYLVRNITTNTWSNTSRTSGGFIPLPLQFGPNIIRASANFVADNDVTVNATCATVMYSGICFPRPTITLTVADSLLRRGGQTEVSLTVNDFPYPLECTIRGATSAPINFDHTGSTPTETYSYPTGNLISAQIIDASCRHVGSGLYDTAEVRVNVLPSIQES